MAAEKKKEEEGFETDKMSSHFKRGRVQKRRRDTHENGSTKVGIRDKIVADHQVAWYLQITQYG